MKVFGMDCILDGELLSPSVSGLKEHIYVVWDIPVYRGKDLTKEMYATRLAILARYWSDFKSTGRIRIRHNLHAIGLYTLDQIDGMIKLCDGKFLEGIVAKDLTSTLEWSRIKQVDTTSQLKWRAKSS
jgi:ATP-dependent DNA ligase